MADKEELTRTIIEVIQETLSLKSIPPIALSGDSAIGESLGLESLDWAAIVAVLEEKTQVDPFQHGLTVELRTVADLVGLYAAEIDRSVGVGESV
jgi:acyl carrier protein